MKLDATGAAVLVIVFLAASVACQHYLALGRGPTLVQLWQGAFAVQKIVTIFCGLTVAVLLAMSFLGQPPLMFRLFGIGAACLAALAFVNRLLETQMTIAKVGPVSPSVSAPSYAEAYMVLAVGALTGALGLGIAVYRARIASRPRR